MSRSTDFAGQLGENIRQARLRLGLSQTAFGEAIGQHGGKAWNKSAVSLAENGDLLFFEPLFLAAMAEVTKTPIDRLLLQGQDLSGLPFLAKRYNDEFLMVDSVQKMQEREAERKKINAEIDRCQALHEELLERLDELNTPI